ncbi:MAG: peptidase [Spongiibacteraceae bacterium]
MRLKEGLVFVSDTRTNAGVDHIATFRKMHIFERRGERSLVLLTSGNLATAQSVIGHLCEGTRHEDTPNLYSVTSMFGAAQLIGDTISDVILRSEHHGQQCQGVDFGCNILLGGQIAGERPRLFHVYPQGNFIEATEDTPYFQIGESKYGKPILDRIISFDTPLERATKCTLISFDSTIKSNISVGMPLDFARYREDSFELQIDRIAEDDEYFRSLRTAWGGGLRKLFEELP